MEVPYHIQPSSIHGEGLFTTRRIVAGEMILMPMPAGFRCKGFNHSCQPNVGVHSELLTHRPALRDIEVGEELTVSYSSWRAICNCPRCRRTP